MHLTPMDDHEADYWNRQIRLGSLIAVGVTLLGGVRVALDWAPADQWLLIPILCAVVLQAVAAGLPWKRIVRRHRVRQALVLWWVAEIPLLFLFANHEANGSPLYLPGATLIIVLVAALYPPLVVVSLGILTMVGYLALLSGQPHVSVVSVIGMSLIMVSVVGVTAVNAHNRRRLDSCRRSAERRTELLLENSADAVLAVGVNGEIRYASPSMQAILGRRSGVLGEDSLTELVHPEDVPHLQEWFAALWSASNGHTARTETRMHRADGSLLYLDVIGTNRMDDPDLHAAIISLRDIGVRRTLEEQLTRQAFSDSLTGLANRALFRDRLEHATARRRTGPVTALLIDLDEFKLVNDNLGHSAGDELLITIAGRLRGQLRAGDTLARLGGDEFAILVEDLDEAETTALAERLLHAVRQPVRLASRDITCTASIGIATADDHHELRAEGLLRNADLAMYAAKRSGRNAYATFDPSMYATVLHEAQQRDDMELALTEKQFVVHYQPVVDLPTQQLIGVEALVRWQHPRDGLIGPDHFIHAAEASGLIVPLGGWVLRQACRQLAQWQRETPAALDLKMNVNLSARQFQYPGLVADVEQAITDAGIAPGGLTLEITESMLMRDIESTIETLHALRHLGVRIAIDDFGTGYSSLSYLKQLPVDIIKIDRAFIEKVDTDADDIALVDAVVGLGQALSLQTVAEGIETSEQWEKLRQLGCEYGQGYLFGRPGEAALISQFLGNQVPADPIAA